MKSMGEWAPTDRLASSFLLLSKLPAYQAVFVALVLQSFPDIVSPVKSPISKVLVPLDFNEQNRIFPMSSSATAASNHVGMLTGFSEVSE